MNVNKQTYKCDKCNKNYASYQSLWNHNKRKHKPQYNCTYCDSVYKHKQSKCRHEQKCKTQKPKNEEIELEKIKLELLKEEHIKNEIEVQKLKEENAKMKIQFKMCKTGGNIITNNGTINNVFVKYNDISYDTLTNQERNEIFNSYNMIEESINKIHFNSNNPEQNNIYITNLKDPYCNIFDGNQFSTIKKNELLPDLIDLHLFELYLSKKKYKLKDNVVAKIDKLEEKLNKNPNKYIDENDKTYKNYKDYMIEIVKILIYNSCDKNKLDAIKKIDNFVRKELDTFDDENL